MGTVLGSCGGLLRRPEGITCPSRTNWVLQSRGGQASVVGAWGSSYLPIGVGLLLHLTPLFEIFPVKLGVWEGILASVCLIPSRTTKSW
jgi:hypothetical protein